MSRFAHLAAPLLGLYPVRMLRRVVQRFFSDEGPRNAAALTYTSLFAVVPLLTVTYAMLAALPVFRGVGDQLQGLLFQHFVPATGEVVQDYLGSFATQARQLTLVGVAFLILTAGMMIVNIEKAFNGIWRVEKPRRGLQAFLIYWTVLTLGPMLLGAGIMLSSYLTSLPLLEKLAEPVGGSGGLLRFLPFVLSSLAFTLLYWAVPHCKVRFKHALYGGLLMAFLFELAKKTFTWFVTGFPSYELVYGAFAAVPLFLLWIYLSWMLILLCGEWVALLGAGEEEGPRIDRLPVALQGLVVIAQVWQKFVQGQGVSDSELRQSVGSMNPDAWQQLMHTLQTQGWLILDTERDAWVAGRDYHQVTLADWLQTLPWRLPPVSQWPENLPLPDQLMQKLAQLEVLERDHLAQPISDWLSAEPSESNE